jgi:DNA replication licensing factor MCM7
MRREEALSVRPLTYTSARSLLAIVRLSCALARLRLDENVRDSDVLEAKRLVEASRGGLEENDEGNADTGYSRTITMNTRPGTVDDR